MMTDAGPATRALVLACILACLRDCQGGNTNETDSLSASKGCVRGRLSGLPLHSGGPADTQTVSSLALMQFLPAFRDADSSLRVFPSVCGRLVVDGGRWRRLSGLLNLNDIGSCSCPCQTVAAPGGSCPKAKSVAAACPALSARCAAGRRIIRLRCCPKRVIIKRERESLALQAGTNSSQSLCFLSTRNTRWASSCGDPLFVIADHDDIFGPPLSSCLRPRSLCLPSTF